VNLRKMLLPRLTSLLRHGCYGSASSSLPALLPLLPLLPPGTLGPAPDVLVNLLEAVWAGAADPAAQSRCARAAVTGRCVSASCAVRDYLPFVCSPTPATLAVRIRSCGTTLMRHDCPSARVLACIVSGGRPTLLQWCRTY
jgi:hypothetical protein